MTGVWLSCPCHNVQILVESIPSKEDTPFWILDLFNNLAKGTGVTSVFTTTENVPLLCENREIEQDGNLWTCLVCVNCDTFVSADKNTGDGRKYINMSLQKFDPDNHSQRSTSSQYSPVWKIMLKGDEDVLNSVLEPPDIEDKDRYHNFKLLQTQMQNYLLEEETAMQNRIKAFEQRQMEELRDLKSRSYRDRKVLWHCIDKQLMNRVAMDLATTTDDVTATTNIVEVDKGNEELIDIERKSRDKNVPASPTAKVNIWKNSRISDKDKLTQSSEWLFQFDDEDEHPSTPDRVYVSADEIDMDDENENEPEHLYEDINDTRAPGFHMAASLPVTIPNAFLTRKTTNKAPVSPQRADNGNGAKGSRKPLEGGFDTPESTNSADMDILSKSFAIPMSRNRVRGWL